MSCFVIEQLGLSLSIFISFFVSQVVLSPYLLSISNEYLPLSLASYVALYVLLFLSYVVLSTLPLFLILITPTVSVDVIVIKTFSLFQPSLYVRLHVGRLVPPCLKSQ